MTDTTPQVKKDVVPAQYREKYKATGGTCGDFIGTKLQEVGKDGPTALQAVMRENEIPATRWGGLNVGQQRMNLANVLRSRLLNGQDVYILGKQYNVTHMLEDYNGTVERDNPASIQKFAEAHQLQTNDRTVKALTKTFFDAADRAKREEEKALAKKQKDEEKAAKEKEKAEKAAAKEAEKAAKAAEKEAARKAREEEKAAAKAAKPAKAEKVKEPA